MFEDVSIPTWETFTKKKKTKDDKKNNKKKSTQGYDPTFDNGMFKTKKDAFKHDPTFDNGMFTPSQNQAGIGFEPDLNISLGADLPDFFSPMGKQMQQDAMNEQQQAPAPRPQKPASTYQAPIDTLAQYYKIYHDTKNLPKDIRTAINKKINGEPPRQTNLPEQIPKAQRENTNLANIKRKEKPPSAVLGNDLEKLADRIKGKFSNRESNLESLKNTSQAPPTNQPKYYFIVTYPNGTRETIFATSYGQADGMRKGLASSGNIVSDVLKL
jgi:hypothetical protein